MSRAPAVIIVGAGVTGLGAAYHLRAGGIPYTILEASDDLGGVWNTHRWHGSRCDSDFVKYSFSFRPFLSERRVQGRAEIHRYLRAVAREFEILENIKFGTRALTAAFDAGEARWVVHTDRGTLAARFLINGNGYFGDPHVPVFQDADRFRGEIVHTAALDDRRTFVDQDVVLVGSGSTAMCCAPELSRVARSLVLLQRSPSYVYEISNRVGWLTILCQDLHRLGIRFPVRVLRHGLQVKDDAIFVGFRRYPRLARWIFERHWVPAIGRESFQEHFRPRYDPWEQRIGVAIGLKEKLRNGTIALRTGEIQRFTESSIVLKSGEDLPCDTCILATGFDLRFLKFALYAGESRIEVGGLNLYKGIMMGGVPNYFHPVGVWHSAWTQRSETVCRFAVRIMTYMERHGFRTVSIDRREIDGPPRITPNYVTRCLPVLPRLHGTHDLPSIDNLVSYRFKRRDFNFA